MHKKNRKMNLTKLQVEPTVVLCVCVVSALLSEHEEMVFRVNVATHVTKFPSNGQIWPKGKYSHDRPRYSYHMKHISVFQSPHSFMTVDLTIDPYQTNPTACLQSSAYLATAVMEQNWKQKATKLRERER